MYRLVQIAVLIAALAVVLPPRLQGQSDEISLGDLARSLRRNQAPPRTVIDNDNLPAVMEEGENRKWASKAPTISLDESVLRSVKAESPDVTCALSFNGQVGKGPLDDLIKPQSLPTTEIIKLEGPAIITGDSLQVSVHNGSGWELREITVGLTVVRRENTVAEQGGGWKVIPAAINSTIVTEKHPDVTVLYHMKGSAAPSSITVFEAPLNIPLAPDQEWHWAIVQAKGIPPAETPEPVVIRTIQAPN